MKLLLCFASVALAFAGQTRDAPARPPTTGTALIAGVIVTDEPSPKPIRQARVTLNNLDRTVGRTVATDDEGRFVFSALPANRYALEATKPAFLRVEYGAKRPGRAGTPVTVADGQQLTNLTMKMTRGGVIAGVVRDQNGLPAPGVTVSVMQYIWRDGERVLAGAGTGSNATDDRGRYRTYGLPAGELIVVAKLDMFSVPMSGGVSVRETRPGDVQRAIQQATAGGRSATPASPSQPERTATVAYAPVFYPGTADPAGALPIVLAPGQVRDDIDLQLQLVPTGKIEGVISIPSGVPSSNVSVSVTRSQVQTTLGQFAGMNAATPGRDGSYRILGVAAGNYAVTARATTSYEPASAGTQPAPLTYWAATDVTVDGRDLNVPLTLQPGLTMSGRLAFDGASPVPASGSRVQMYVRRGSESSVIALTIGITQDGRFSVPGLVPARYRVAGLSPLPGWVLKSAVAEGRSVLDGPLEIRPGQDITDAVLTFTDRPSKLTGALQDTAGRPATDYFIIVFPTDKSYWTPGAFRIRQARPANDGTFEVANLPAGDYFIGALTDVESGEWFEPAFLDALAPVAWRVSIADGRTTVQNLKIG
jgi:hypothetical protein